MSVIVWDGKTLAADRQHTSHNRVMTVTKIFRHGDMLIGGVGTVHVIAAMIDWVMGGMDKDKFPRDAMVDEPGRCSPLWLINRNGTIAVFSNSPYPQVIRDKQFADGSGSDIAMGALAMGADAVKAVEVASRYDIYCGGGVDVLSFDD